MGALAPIRWGVLQRTGLPVVLSVAVLSIVVQQVTHQTEWLHLIRFIVSQESIGFDWVTPVLESLGPHVVACRVAGLHVCPLALLHVASVPAEQPVCLPGGSEERRLPESQDVVSCTLCW